MAIFNSYVGSPEGKGATKKVCFSLHCVSCLGFLRLSQLSLIQDMWIPQFPDPVE